MTKQVLIAYASRHGSTAEIAAAIAKELTDLGQDTTTAHMKDISSVNGYDLVILGAPLYMGRLEKDFSRFISRFGSDLQNVPVAAFAVGLAPVRKEPDVVQTSMDTLCSSLGSIKPVSTALFAGRVDPAQLSFISRKIIAMVKAPSGDFREWDKISAWAREIGNEG